jgi:hypothetical protein
MSCITRAQRRLREAVGLAAVLDAAYEAFEDMMSVTRAPGSAGGGTAALFVTLAKTVAEGRNAVLLAPSLPPHCLQETPEVTEGGHPVEGAESIAVCIVALSQLLATRLAQAARSAPDYRDRAACRSATRRARDIHALLAGAGL